MALYDAFISYSHAKDKAVASALQTVIQKLGKPWYRRRALRIFRDDTSLAATPELWPSLETVLGQSRYIIVLASPEFARSKWCGMEVAHWLAHKSTATLLVAVTDGELRWDGEAGDFVWDEATPLPAVLKGHFRSEPKWIDLRAHRDAPDHRDAKFVDAGADLAAAVHGLPKEDLLSQEVRQQKRALRLAWSAAASLLILAGGAGWQWWEAETAKGIAIEQRNEAQRQRDRAEANLAAATSTANTLVFDLAQEFRTRTGMPVDLVRTILDRAQALQEQLAKSGETAPNLRHSTASALDALARALLAQGDTNAALKVARRSRAISEDLIVLPTAPVQWSQNHAITISLIGDILVAAGRREEALAAYRDSFAIRKKLARDHPDNVNLVREHAVGFEHLGDVLLASGRGDEALSAYRSSLAIAKRLADSKPDDGWLQHDLSVTHDRLAGILLTAGRREEALATFRTSAAIRERLIRIDPDNAVWQRDLAISYDKTGNVLRLLKRRAESIEVHGKSLAIAQKLAAADPANARNQRDLAMSYNFFADALRDAGQWTEAVAANANALAIIERLAAADPGNARSQRDIAVTRERLGDLYRMLGRSEEALAAFQQSLAIRRKLIALDAGNDRWQRDLRLMLTKVGDVLFDMGRVEDARPFYDERLRLQADSAETAAQRGRVHLYSGNLRGAVEDLTRALEIRPSYAYAMLWLHIARRRAEPDRATGLAETAARIDRRKWPWPVLAHALGSLTAEGLRTAALSAGDETTRSEQTCEVDFYLGVDRIDSGAPADARPLLEAAARNCPRTFVEYGAAKLELRRLERLTASQAQP